MTVLEGSAKAPHDQGNADTPGRPGCVVRPTAGCGNPRTAGAGVTGLLVGKLLGCLAAGVVLGRDARAGGDGDGEEGCGATAGCSHPAAAAVWAARGAGRGGNPAGSRVCPARSA